MSAAELELLLGALSTSRQGRLSNEDRLFMSIPPSPPRAKPHASGDQVSCTALTGIVSIVICGRCWP